jgi:four helix bundle protein
MQRFTEIRAWQRGHALVLNVYRATVGFPQAERYGIISQLRRAVVSVPTNIAEGSKRASNQDYARFLNMAEGSLAETEYLMMVSQDLGYLPTPAGSALLKEARELARMLHALRQKVETAK